MNALTTYEDGSYLARNPTWHEEDSAWKANRIITLLKDNKIQPSTICEVGCGAGAILNCLADSYGANVLFYGYEISPQAFEICKSKERQNLRFVLQNLLEVKESFFDIAMAIDVFEHVEDYIGFLRDFRSKGRYKVFHIPLDLSVQTVLRCSPLLVGRETVGHIHYFTKETALATLNDSGYRVMDYTYTNISLVFSRYGWKNRLMRHIRKLFFAIHKDLAVRILGGFSLLVLAE